MLHLAAMNNHPEIIDFLISSPVAKKLEMKFDSLDGEGCNMLHHAARRGCVDALKKILEMEGELIYSQDRLGNTALHHASANSIYLLTQASQLV